MLIFGFSLCVFAKDPTQPISDHSVKATAKKIVSSRVQQPLTAIFTKKNGRQAVIEGRIYKVGEYYAGNKIIKIYQDSVLLNSSNGNFHLTLIPNIKK